MSQEGRHVVLVDSNRGNINRAKELGLSALQANIYNEDLDDQIELLDMGYLMAMTGSAEVNMYACEKFEKDFGELGTYRLITSDELNVPMEQLPDDGLFSSTDDFINLSEVARDHGEIHELEIVDQEDFEEKIAQFHANKIQIPLFVKDLEGFLQIIPADPHKIAVDAGWQLVYMGEIYAN